MTREMNAQNNISLEEACQGHMPVAHQLLPPDRLRCTPRHTWCHTSRGLFGSSHHEKCFNHSCHFDTVAGQGSCSAGYDDGTCGHFRALTCTSGYLVRQVLTGAHEFLHKYVKNSRVRRWYIRKNGGSCDTHPPNTQHASEDPLGSSQRLCRTEMSAQDVHGDHEPHNGHRHQHG